MSVAPPGAYGTTIFTGLLGYLSCATAGPRDEAQAGQQQQAKSLHLISSVSSLIGLPLRTAPLLAAFRGIAYAAFTFTPCRLCEASLQVKNTTSASGVALPEWIAFDGT